MDHVEDHLTTVTKDTGEITTSPGIPPLHSTQPAQPRREAVTVPDTYEGTLPSHSERSTHPGHPVAPDDMADAVHDSEELERLEAMYAREQQGRGRVHDMYPRDKRRLRAYGATLAAGTTILPLVALVFTITLYFALPGVTGWITLLAGLLATLASWLIIALPLQFLTSRDKVNTRSYGLLVSRLNQLETRLSLLQSLPHRKLEEYQQIALEEAYDNFQVLDTMLYESTARLPWVLGMGYAVAWETLHRAEEALIEAEPVEMVAREAYHDRMAIANSSMTNCNDLLDKLHDAVKLLDPGMGSVVASSSSSADVIEEVQEVEESVQKVGTQLKTVGQNVQRIEQYLQKLVEEQDHQAKLSEDPIDTSNGDRHASGDESGDKGDKADEARARGTLREIRRTLNEYRDQLFSGILRGRNRLMGGVFITGFATYVLLGVAILATGLPGSSSQGEQAALLAATVYYVVGTIAGLFSAIYRQSTVQTDAATRTDVDDYGLTIARLISTPLLSGLAGIGGAVIYSTLVIQASSSASFTLPAIFNLNRLDYLIAAAAFGFAPGLLFQGLQQRDNSYISALQSSKASGRPGASDNS
jgi:hypothetical protein